MAKREFDIWAEVANMSPKLFNLVARAVPHIGRATIGDGSAATLKAWEKWIKSYKVKNIWGDSGCLVRYLGRALHSSSLCPAVSLTSPGLTVNMNYGRIMNIGPDNPAVNYTSTRDYSREGYDINIVGRDWRDNPKSVPLILYYPTLNWSGSGGWVYYDEGRLLRITGYRARNENVLVNTVTRGDGSDKYYLTEKRYRREGRTFLDVYHDKVGGEASLDAFIDGAGDVTEIERVTEVDAEAVFEDIFNNFLDKLSVPMLLHSRMGDRFIRRVFDAATYRGVV